MGAIAAFSATFDETQPQRQQPSCWDDPPEAAVRRQPQSLHLKPRDDGPRRPDFAKFRRLLQDAVTRKDTTAVLRVVDPHVKVDFGGGAGIEAFRDRMNDPEENFWEEFAKVLALGGGFRTPNAFDAPYTYSDWPDHLDAFDCLAVIGRGVRLRAAPRTSARTLAIVDFAIVQSYPGEPDIPEWKRVRLATGHTGYIASRLIRSPVDYRALFEFKEGQWWLVAFIAGD